MDANAERLLTQDDIDSIREIIGHGTFMFFNEESYRLAIFKCHIMDNPEGWTLSKGNRIFEGIVKTITEFNDLCKSLGLSQKNLI